MIRVEAFTGGIPRRAGKKLEPQQAQLALNADLASGDLRPLRGLAQEAALPHAGTLETIYLFAGQFWFAWDADVDVVKAPFPLDTIERTYWTGDGYPKATSSEIATAGGGTSYPNNHFRLGIPAPASAPVPIVDPGWSGTPPVEANANEFQAWVYTYVSAWGEEGPPSDPSVVFSRDRDTDGNLLPIQLTMAGAPAGQYQIAAKRIYRLNTGSAGAEYQFVKEVPVATLTTTDDVENDDLAEILLTTEWDPPPDTLQGLRVLPNGVGVGFDGKDVYFSEPYQLHAWPRSYMVTMDADIVGIETFGNTVFVGTTDRPYLIAGSDPATTSVLEVEINQACVSKKSITRLGLEGVAYASPDGIVLVGPGSAQLITLDAFTREEWQALKPESMIGVAHDTAYICFYDTGAVQGSIMLDPTIPGIVHTDITAAGAFVDRETDTLYLLDGASNVKKWNADAKLTAEWTSGIHHGPPRNYPFGQVDRAGTGFTSCSLEVYADGVLKHTETVADAEPFRLPSGFLARDWYVKVITDDDVAAVRLGDLESLT